MRRLPSKQHAAFPPNGGVSEDATPQLHLRVGVSVHGRDDGGAVPELYVPISRRPDLADPHPPLHPRPVGAGAADAHLHPPGPEQGQTPGAAAAPPAARTHRQVGQCVDMLALSCLLTGCLVVVVVAACFLCSVCQALSCGM